MKSHILWLPAIIFSLTLTVYAQRDRQLAQETPNASTDRRIALVIGNATYIHAPALKNPANDATDMATTLSGLGFIVEHGINLTQRQMKQMIREFGKKLRAGEQGLFYFAGHGVQLRGRNFLIPVDADIQSETDVEDQGVDANLVMGFMDEAGNGLNVVILDACRNNPFARSFRSAANGLAQVEAPTGTLIAYATSPGSVANDGNARNGLYTQELLRFMRIPDLSIEEVFKQVRISVRKLTQGRQTPWEASSLTGDFYFIASANSKAGAHPSNAMNPAQPLSARPLPPTSNEAISIIGTYLDAKKDGSYIEFKSDRTFYYLQVINDSVYQFIGKYEVEGKQVTVVLETGQADKGTIDKDTIRFQDGSVYVKAAPGTAIPPPKFSNQAIKITNVSFTPSFIERFAPSLLFIYGNGWKGGADIKVMVNGQEISRLIYKQDQYSIQLKGTTRDLNIHNGKNEVVIIANGAASNTYEFKQVIK